MCSLEAEHQVLELPRGFRSPRCSLCFFSTAASIRRLPGHLPWTFIRKLSSNSAGTSLGPPSSQGKLPFDWIEKRLD